MRRLTGEIRLLAGALRPRAHSEWILGAGAMAAWACIGLMVQGEAQGRGLGLSALCLGGASGLARLQALLGAPVSRAAAMVPLHWAAMLAAMVPVLALQPIRHVRLRSFRERRGRATAAFLVGYTAPWLLAGGVAAIVAVLADLAPAGRLWASAAAGLIAALAPLSGVRRRALYRCHRTASLAPSGWAADRDCAGFGLSQGLACLTTCGWLMTALALAGGGLLPCLAALMWQLLERGPTRYPALIVCATPAVVAALALLDGAWIAGL